MRVNSSDEEEGDEGSSESKRRERRGGGNDETVFGYVGKLRVLPTSPHSCGIGACYG